MRMILRILLVAIIFYVGADPIDAYTCPVVGPDDHVICYINCVGGSYTTSGMTRSQCCSYFDSNNGCYGDGWRSSLFCPTYIC